MATRKYGVRGLGSAAAAGLGVVAGVLACKAAERGRLNALCARVERLEDEARTAQNARANLVAWQQRQHWELLSKAIDDPELAEVLDHYEGNLTPKQRRQYLFANAMYTNLLTSYRIGNLSKDEFFQHVRGMLQNPVMREYWHAGEQQRASLADTEEAGLGLIVDELLHELEEADPEEWWVVGDPPGEQ
ncbi:DUF6082 family protein [Streptomyces sp. NPDC002814]